MDGLNIEKNRAEQKYPPRLQFMRLAWGVGRLLFRLIPRPLYAPRRVLLRIFGAKVGRNVNISNTATIYFPWNFEINNWAAIGERVMVYNLGKVSIGEKATVSQGAHLCAGSHDFLDPSLPLLTPPIEIGAQAWICADAFVGPGVVVGEGAVVGARAVVVGNVEPWAVVAGNPARFIKRRELKESE
ncbi:MAG: putative colanic acid biosynthesis acetyltransferase [Verrucomicrobiota bacterium]